MKEFIGSKGFDMPLDYIILMVVGVLGIGCGLLLLREAKKHRAHRQAGGTKDEGKMVNSFAQGFIKGAKETPRAFFAPAVAIWRLLQSTTESLIDQPNDKTHGCSNAHSTLKEKKMYKSNNSEARTMAIVAGFFVCLMVFVFAAGNQSRAFAPKMTRLTLTTAGCSYVSKRAGITGAAVTEGCEVDVLFVENHIGNGGVIIYGQDDDGQIEISESQIVGAMKLVTDRPLNSRQQWAIVWIFAAAGLMASLLFLLMWDNRQDEMRKSSNKH